MLGNAPQGMQPLALGQGQLPTPTHTPLPIPFPGSAPVTPVGGAAPGTPVGTPLVVTDVSQLPDAVRKYLLSLSQSLTDRKVFEVHQAIESGWNGITSQYFKASKWPAAEVIAPLVDYDDTFLVLYKELSFRHIYSNLQPTAEDRVASWENYLDLFSMLLDVQRPVRLDLPNQWIWDIIDEFIYQFQSFCQFRSKRKARTDAEIAVLKANPGAFSATTVLELLEKAATKSKIRELTAAIRESGHSVQSIKGGTFNGGPGAPDDEFARSNTYVMLGYFALIGQARVHCLLSDYLSALRALDSVDMSKKNGLFTKVAACHVTLYYYVGFAYLMMKRYTDAARSFSSAIIFVQRTKQYHTRSYQYDAIMKKTEQMYVLLAISNALSPGRIDDNIRASLREKLGDKAQRMQQGEEAVFEELFTFACPKFVVPAAPDYNTPPANIGQEAYRQQLRLFLAEVRQQHVLPNIRSYLRLYTSISVEKLAGFLELPVATVRAHVMALKHKFRRPQWPGHGAPPLAGDVVNCADVEFYVENDVIHVIEQKNQGTYHTDFFVRNINKLGEVRARLPAL